MATHAILDVANTFFGMHGQHLGGLVFVATKTSVAGEVAAGVTGGARRVVRTGEREKAAMVERRRFPGGLRMALCTVAAGLAVERVRRRAVARRALAPYVGPQEVVREAVPRCFHQLRSAMVGVASVSPIGPVTFPRTTIAS